MHIFKKLAIIKHPRVFIHNLFDITLEYLAPYLDDELYLKLRWRLVMGYSLNLSNPKTFCEKLQWLKLHDHNPMYTKMVDKVQAKDYASKIIGKDYIIPTIEVYKRAEDIDIDQLPDKFVIKVNHNSGSVFICRDKNNFDFELVRTKLSEQLKKNFYWTSREWPYKNVPPKILVEKLIIDDNHPQDSLNDLKFYCFDGEPKIVMQSSGRFGTQLFFDYYDMDWNLLPLVWDKPNSGVISPCPPLFDEMKDICRRLSGGIPHMRVDLYNVNNHIYFGELTFYDNSGYCKFEDESWDYKLGEMIHLPIKQL